MQRSIIEKLNLLNHTFYRDVAKDFDQTRQSAWQGWNGVLGKLDSFTGKKLRVLDVGCGNGRFLDFLVKNLPDLDIEYTGVDLNPELLELAKNRTAQFDRVITRWENYDLVATWLKYSDLTKLTESPWDQNYDLIVVFGVMHHIPSAQQRFDWLDRFQKSLAPNGFLVVTDWQFSRESARFSEKTIPPEKLGFTTTDLEPNDYFLDWQQGKVSYRYCHETTETERSQQNETLQQHNPRVSLVGEYDADGKFKLLNHYRVWHSKNL